MTKSMRSRGRVGRRCEQVTPMRKMNECTAAPHPTEQFWNEAETSLMHRRCKHTQAWPFWARQRPVKFYTCAAETLDGKGVWQATLTKTPGCAVVERADPSLYGEGTDTARPWLWQGLCRNQLFVTASGTVSKHWVEWNYETQNST